MKVLFLSSLIWIFAFAAFGDDEQVQIPWRVIAPENLLIIDTDYGRTVIELNPEFAPNHVEQIRRLAKQKFYDGLTFYRVIDGFVAQGGRGEGKDARALPDGFGTLKNENDRTSDGLEFAPVVSPDLYAKQSGHVNGFAAARNPDTGRTWLQHCPGSMAMARNNDPDSGDAEFYIVLGPGTRYLDRNLTVFGRIIDGMEFIQKLNRGVRSIDSGVIADIARRDVIRKFTIAADMPLDSRPVYEVMATPSDEFEIFKVSKRIRNEPFFYRQPPKVIEACTVVAPARMVGK
ncbi:MAG: peptidylprolyl isomerase [Robiginitomaculum sp.]|nr:peptidylprolyl isomerase [Robiginitomaculum sp.]